MSVIYLKLSGAWAGACPMGVGQMLAIVFQWQDVQVLALPHTVSVVLLGQGRQDSGGGAVRVHLIL